MPTQQSGFPTLTRAGFVATAATGQQNVATLTGAPVAGPGLGGCLTQNGDFSNGSVGWALNAADGVDTTPADAPPGSSTCLKRTASGAVDGTTQTLPVLPNTTMAAGAYLKGDGTNGVQIAATYLNNAGVALGTEQLSAAQTAAGWALQTVALATPGNCASVRLSLKTTAASTTYAGRIGLVAGGTYADSQFSANPLGNTSLVACEATTNLLSDGDCEGVGGTTTSVLFTDSFANANAWTKVSGATAPTAASNVLTVAAGSEVVAGHPDWWDTQASGGVSACQVRFQPQAGWSSVNFTLSYVDLNNGIALILNTASLSVQKFIAGAFTSLQSAPITVVVGTSYWLVWSISSVGTTRTVTASICADGAVPGAALATVSGSLNDAVLQTGKFMVGANSAAMLLGQMGGTAYAGVCQVSGPRPSAWSPVVSAGVPAFCWSKAQAFSGSYSLSASVSGGDTSGSGRWRTTQTLTAVPYALSGRTKVAGATGAGATVAIGATASSGITGTADWQAQYVVVNPAAAGSTNLDYLLTGPGSAYFDALGLE